MCALNDNSQKLVKCCGFLQKNAMVLSMVAADRSKPLRTDKCIHVPRRKIFNCYKNQLKRQSKMEFYSVSLSSTIQLAIILRMNVSISWFSSRKLARVLQYPCTRLRCKLVVHTRCHSFEVAQEISSRVPPYSRKLFSIPS